MENSRFQVAKQNNAIIHYTHIRRIKYLYPFNNLFSLPVYSTHTLNFENAGPVLPRTLESKFIQLYWMMWCTTPYCDSQGSPEKSTCRYVQKVSSHVMRKMEISTEEDTRYKKQCTQDNDTSVAFKAGSLGTHTVLPMTISCPVIFS